MFEKTMRIILLVILSVFYVLSVTNSNDGLVSTIFVDRVNFFLLVVILYLASNYIKGISALWVMALLVGAVFHGYMFYDTYSKNKGADEPQTRTELCRGPDATWYTKLKYRCY